MRCYRITCVTTEHGRTIVGVNFDLRFARATHAWLAADRISAARGYGLPSLRGVKNGEVSHGQRHLTISLSDCPAHVWERSRFNRRVECTECGARLDGSLTEAELLGPRVVSTEPIPEWGRPIPKHLYTRFDVAWM
jgi:hypothetical protein